MKLTMISLSLQAMDSCQLLRSPQCLPNPVGDATVDNFTDGSQPLPPPCLHTFCIASELACVTSRISKKYCSLKDLNSGLHT
jgi:hypothetical protein